jgi:hypothetical protein
MQVHIETERQAKPYKQGGTLIIKITFVKKGKLKKSLKNIWIVKVKRFIFALPNREEKGDKFSEN